LHLFLTRYLVFGFVLSVVSAMAELRPPVVEWNTHKSIGLWVNALLQEFSETNSYNAIAEMVSYTAMWAGD
jgi:hypothetical protein